MKLIKYSILISLLLSFWACDKDETSVEVDPSDKLAIDSLVATSKNIEVWEQITITAYTRGDSIDFHWSTNHGTMMWTDSNTVQYWGCPSCKGLNTVECEISNTHGIVSDTIMINVHDSSF